MPRHFFQYLIEVHGVIVAIELASGFDKALTLL